MRQGECGYIVFFASLFSIALSVEAASVFTEETFTTAQGEALVIGIQGLPDKDVHTRIAAIHHLINEQARELDQRLAHKDQRTALQGALIKTCEQFRQQTAAQFSCRQGALKAQWEKIADTGAELPARSELRKSSRALSRWSEGQAAPDNLDWDLPLLMRGFILDNALTVLREDTNISSAFIAWGERRVQFDVDEMPGNYRLGLDATLLPASDTHADSVLQVANKAVAINRAEALEWKSGHRRFSRLLDPVDGWPKTFSPSVVVVATDAVTAEALVNALSVTSIAKGIALINRLPDTEALIMTSTGKTFVSDGWYSLVVPDQRHQPLWDSDMEFLVEYQTLPQAVAEYRRPYVAVWITDTRKNSVRQLVVHGESLRWLREIPLWWRRYGRQDETMIDGLSRATPLPGKHLLVWDGRDDRGRKVPAGNYLLHVEAAREHGGHELVTLPFHLSQQNISASAQGESELGEVAIRFRKRPQ